jgi:uncharacterized damage-inducible protein DinB
MSMERLIEPHLKTLLLNARLAENCLEGVDDVVACKRLTSNTNHMAFVFCHLVDVRYDLTRVLGIDVDCPFKELFDKVRSVDDMLEVPALADLRAAWAAVTALVAERLAEAAAAELLEPSGQTFPNEDSTRLGALAFLLQHEAYHIGQLGLLRKALGFMPMHY